MDLSKQVPLRIYQNGYVAGYEAAVKIICEALRNDLVNTKDRDGRPCIDSSSFNTVDELIDYIKTVML